MERHRILSGTFGFTEENLMKDRQVTIETHGQLEQKYRELKQAYEVLDEKYRTLREQCDNLCDRLADFGIRASI